MSQEEFELVSDEAGGTHMMTLEKVKDLISGTFSTEEVKEVYDHIVGSYHYDVFTKGLNCVD